MSSRVEKYPDIKIELVSKTSERLLFYRSIELLVGSAYLQETYSLNLVENAPNSLQQNTLFLSLSYKLPLDIANSRASSFKLSILIYWTALINTSCHVQLTSSSLIPIIDWIKGNNSSNLSCDIFGKQFGKYSPIITWQSELSFHVLFYIDFN